MSDRKIKYVKQAATFTVNTFWLKSKLNAKLSIKRIFKKILTELEFRDKLIATYHRIKYLQENLREWLMVRNLRLDILTNLCFKSFTHLKHKIRTSKAAEDITLFKKME